MVENQKMLNCEQVWREISNYVDGDIDAGLRSAMDEHFRGCQRCASVLAGTRNVVRLYGDERMLEVPAGFGQRLEKRLEKRLARNAAGSGRGMVELVGVAGAGGGAGVDRGRRAVDELADWRAFHAVVPCGTCQQYSS